LGSILSAAFFVQEEEMDWVQTVCGKGRLCKKKNKKKEKKERKGIKGIY